MTSWQTWLRFPLAAGLLSGLISVETACGSIPKATAVPSPSVCGWYIAHTPKASANADIGSISQPPRGGAWALAELDLESLILHWDGARWTVVRQPRTGVLLVTVLALSRTDVWFAGNVGGEDGDLVIEHWNGRGISVVPNHQRYGINWDPQWDFNVQQLAGTRANSIWLLGYYNEDTYLEHWNGSRWSQAEPPYLNGGGWEAISARAKKDVWVVGDSDSGAGKIAHWNGSNWHYIKNPIFRHNSLLFGVLDLGPGDVWINTGNGGLDHFDGRTWRVTPLPRSKREGRAEVGAISRLRHGPLYAGGTGGAAPRRYSFGGSGLAGSASPPVYRSSPRISKRWPLTDTARSGQGGLRITSFTGWGGSSGPCSSITFRALDSTVRCCRWLRWYVRMRTKG